MSTMPVLAKLGIYKPGVLDDESLRNDLVEDHEPLNVWIFGNKSLITLHREAIESDIHAEAFEVETMSKWFSRPVQMVLNLEGTKQDIAKIEKRINPASMKEVEEERIGPTFVFHVARSIRTRASLPYAFVIVDTGFPDRDESEKLFLRFSAERAISRVDLVHADRLAGGDKRILMEFAGDHSEEILEVLRRILQEKWMSDAQTMFVRRAIHSSRITSIPD